MFDSLENAAREVLIARARRSAARRSLADFAVRMHPGFELAAHTKLIISRLEALERGDIKRLTIHAPPQHGKTLASSMLFAAWYLGRNPDKKIALASYGQAIADRNGWAARELVDHENYPFDLKVSSDSRAKDRWDLAGHRGSLLAVGVGAGLTGWSVDLLICDDLIKDYEDAKSETIRESTWNSFTSSAMTRLGRDYRILMIGTRWHFDDVQARVLEAPGSARDWEV